MENSSSSYTRRRKADPPLRFRGALSFLRTAMSYGGVVCLPSEPRLTAWGQTDLYDMALKTQDRSKACLALRSRSMRHKTFESSPRTSRHRDTCTFAPTSTRYAQYAPMIQELTLSATLKPLFSTEERRRYHHVNRRDTSRASALFQPFQALALDFVELIPSSNSWCSLSCNNLGA